MDVVRIGDREVGGGAPVYVIAEAGSNHDRNLDDLLPPDKTMSDLFRELELPHEWHAALFEHATAAGLDFISTPFDFEAVDLLDDLGVKVFKVASYELWHLPLIREVASRGKPIICSTGMADLAD